MTVLPICITGEPVLHEVAEPVVDFDADLSSLVADMFATMEAAPGVGLAAPQVGLGKRIFVYDWTEEDGTRTRGVAVNPELWITPQPVGVPDEDDEEGCLSIPGERFALKRGAAAILRAQDEHGERYELAATGWLRAHPAARVRPPERRALCRPAGCVRHEGRAEGDQARQVGRAGAQLAAGGRRPGGVSGAGARHP